MKEIVYTTEFKRHLRLLSRRYRSIKKDLVPIIEQIQQGEQPGDKIPGVGYQVYKVRIKNSDINKGKSAGYRMIYYLETEDKVILISLYSKSDQSDISPDKIIRVIKDVADSSP